MLERTGFSEKVPKRSSTTKRFSMSLELSCVSEMWLSANKRLHSMVPTRAYTIITRNTTSHATERITESEGDKQEASDHVQHGMPKNPNPNRLLHSS